MDIVPSPSNISVPLEEQLPPLEVPYVATFTYDLGGFEGFPDRLGFTKDGQLNFEARSVDDCASFLQSWLYFGVICEFTERSIEIPQFVHPSLQDGGREVLRWNPCGHEAIVDWENRMNLLDRTSTMATAGRINRVLHHAAFCALELEQMEFAQTPPLPVISLSVKILIEALFGVLQAQRGIQYTPLTPPYLPVLPHCSNEMPVSTKLLMSKMADQGWCPSQMHNLFQKSNHHTLFFLSQTNRKGGRWSGHGSCSSRQCVANNVDMSHYETKHRTPNCSCNFLGVPKLPLIEIIKSGGIPLVSVQTGPHNMVELHIEKANPSTIYTAISHVWSDGLGNPNANALPQCQLEWLSTCLGRLPPRGYQGIYYTYGAITLDAGGLDAISQSNSSRPAPLFWMDTLCIPVDNEYAALRTEAINKMAAYYAQATGTLILDSELQTLRMSVLIAEEILARIAYCAWAGRCWTMQEGAISAICYFQCADGAVQLDGTYYGAQLSWNLETSASGNAVGFIGPYFRELGRNIGRQVRNWVGSKQSSRINASALNKLFLGIILDDFQVRRRTIEHSNVDSAMRFNDEVQNSRLVTVWNELSRRTTTKFEDIYIIMANLLDFNAGQIMKLAVEERMKAILWSSRYIPLSLLYSDGPRLNPGKNYRERWVPSTPRGSMLKPLPVLEFEADGLLLRSSAAEKYSTMVLSKCLHINGYCFLIDAGRQKTYLIKAIRADQDDFQTDSSVATCYVFEKANRGLQNSSGLELKGACLSLTDVKRKLYDSLEDAQGPEGGSSKAPVRLVALYDCPIRVWQVECAGIIPVSQQKEYELLHKTVPVPTTQVEFLRSQWELILQTGMLDPKFPSIVPTHYYFIYFNQSIGMLKRFTESPRLEHPYPRRPFPVAPDLLMSLKIFAFLLVVFLGLPLNLLLTIKLVQRIEPLSKPSIAAIVLFYLIHGAPYLILFPVIANCLNMVFGSRYQMGQIFIWGLLQICVLYFPAVLLFAVWHFSLRGYAYSAWLSTFDEDWTQNDKYGLWWKLISFDLWLSSSGDSAQRVAKKVESLVDFFEKSIKLRMSNLVSTWKQERIDLELVEQEEKKKTMEDMEFDEVVISRLLG
jgi:hypothetical protein